MKPNIARLLTAACALGFIALAGCAGSSSNQAAVPPTQTLTQPMAIHPAPDRITPDTCLSPVVRAVHAAGGTIVLPGCAGYTGGISYPSNNAPADQKVTIEDATSNFNGAPAPPNGGTVLVYLTSKGSGAGSVMFSNTPTNSTLKHRKTVNWSDTHTYTLYEFVLGSLQGTEPIGSPACSGIMPVTCTDTFVSPLTGANVPNGVTVDFELVKNP
jgi:hypothetical protein